MRPPAWVCRLAARMPGPGDRRADGNFPTRILSDKGPAHQGMLFALGNISTPRNQQDERSKEYKSNDSVETSEPRDAMTKCEMDG